MLVLTRKLMERLYIGDSICVTVVRLEGGQVRLGIDAPKDIRVVRGELFDRLAAPAVATPPVPSKVIGERDPVTRPEHALRGSDSPRLVLSRSARRRPVSCEGS